VVDANPPPRASRSRNVALAALFVGLIVIGWGVWRFEAGRAAKQNEPAAAQRIVPSDAELAVLFPTFEGLRQGLLAFSEGLEGADGLTEAVKALAGIDLKQPDALSRVGLEPTGDASAFYFASAFWLVLSSRDPQAATTHVRGLLEARGYTGFEPAAGLPDVLVVRDRASPDRPAAFLAFNNELVFLIFPAAPRDLKAGVPSDPAIASTLFAALHGATERLVDSPRLAAARKRLDATGSDPDTLLVARFPDGAERDKAIDKVLEALGPNGLLAGAFLRGLDQFVASFHVDRDTCSVRLGLLMKAPEANKGLPPPTRDLAQRWVTFQGGALPLGDVLPDDVAALVRLRVNPSVVGTVPQALFDQVVPKGVLGSVHPSLAEVDPRADLLAHLAGDVAVGLLGLDPKAALNPVAWGQGPRALAEALHGFVAFDVQDPAPLLARIGALKPAASAAGAQVADIAIGKWRGSEWRFGSTVLLVLSEGKRFVVVNGEGERERLERVARGELPSLGAASKRSLEACVASGEPHLLSALATTGRVVRELRRRGIPDYFTGMLGGIRSIAATLDLDAESLLLRAEAVRERGP